MIPWESFRLFLFNFYMNRSQKSSRKERKTAVLATLSIRDTFRGNTKEAQSDWATVFDCRNVGPLNHKTWTPKNRNQATIFGGGNAHQNYKSLRRYDYSVVLSKLARIRLLWQTTVCHRGTLAFSTAIHLMNNSTPCFAASCHLSTSSATIIRWSVWITRIKNKEFQTTRLYIIPLD